MKLNRLLKCIRRPAITCTTCYSFGWAAGPRTLVMTTIREVEEPDGNDGNDAS